MRYLNASQAAIALGISDKTIRRWIKDNRYNLAQLFRRTDSNLLVIDEQEIERIRQEHVTTGDVLSHLIDTHIARQEETTSAPELALERKVRVLETEIAALRARLTALEATRTESHVSTSAPQARPDSDQPRPDARKRAVEPLPDGAILASEFAKQHGVSPRTFLDHITRGIAGEKAIVTERPNPARPGETKRYLSPEQQIEALNYWHRHGVQFSVELVL